MPNYSSGKIYRIVSPHHPLPYIGSTTQPLANRMALHRKTRTCTSRLLIDAGDASIELVEEFPCQTMEELTRREGEVMRTMECVNRRVAGRTRKEYYQENRKAVCEQVKQYYETHREKVCARMKAYYLRKKEAKLVEA